MENELVLLNDILKEIVIGQEISGLKVKEGVEGFEISFSFGNNRVFESGWKSNHRANGQYLCWYVSVDGQEIFNEVDRRICVSKS